jgi:hypothetical protein
MEPYSCLVQAKLRIGAPNDRYEQEADRVAEHVMRMPEPNHGIPSRTFVPAGVSPASIQREHASGVDNAPCPECENELRRQPEEEEDLRAKPESGDGLTVTPRVQAQIHAMRGGGHPLDPATRAFMEPRFGADFSGVRVHTDVRAAESAGEVHARAYTVGQDVVFGAHEYLPGTGPGKRLLAHELAHVLQQGSAVHRKPTLERESAADRSSVNLPGQEENSERQTGVPFLQRDFAISPPNPTAPFRTLTTAEIQDAIRYNTLKLGAADASLIEQLRDVLGISPLPAVLDDEFVNAVARWQAVNNLTQDGKLGPDTAAPLFRELRAEGLTTESRTLATLVRRGRVRTGPTYTPNGTVTAPAGAGRTVPFTMAAEFEHDPLNGVWASCCEVRQDIQWDATMAASFAATGDPVPHGGFPATHPADTRIEDRNAGNTLRYGHRTGFGGAVAGNRYVNAAGTLDQANGTRFEGRDSPGMLAADTGQMTFTLYVVDVCNEGRRIGGTDTITINW